MAGPVTRPLAGEWIVIVETAQPSRLPGDEPRRIDATAGVALEPPGPGRVVHQDADGGRRTALVGSDRPAVHGRRRTIEVVVDGWRFELEVEDARRAALRARATRDRGAALGTAGPLEIRAIIPGRVAASAVAPGDVVAAGQTLLVVEAMKMQNELRAPRDGTVARVAVGVGATIDLGDLLVVLE
jgi:acetyl/propionyl-CoA carboxylase alpha subunit